MCVKKERRVLLEIVASDDGKYELNVCTTGADDVSVVLSGIVSFIMQVSNGNYRYMLDALHDLCLDALQESCIEEAKEEAAADI